MEKPRGIKPELPNKIWRTPPLYITGLFTNTSIAGNTSYAGEAASRRGLQPEEYVE
jgi:hypothetical protein